MYGTCSMLVQVFIMKTSAAICCAAPMPAEPKVSLPGFDLASAISSCTFFTPSAGFTTSTLGWSATRITGAKSLIGSNGNLV